MPKDPITLNQLLQYLDSSREEIQIVDGDSWDSYTEMPAESYLLKPFLHWKIKCLEAVCEDVIRVELIEPEKKEEEEVACEIRVCS